MEGGEGEEGGRGRREKKEKKKKRAYMTKKFPCKRKWREGERKRKRRGAWRRRGREFHCLLLSSA